MNAPSGTVTFLFTDIEGSTPRWERDRIAMADALERHEEIVREAVEARGGYVFKTVGDEFCCAFPHAPAAVEAAIAVQLGLAAHDFGAVDGIVVRAAIHTGAASERDGDYFGPPVNRVARLLALAHGGQVLLSSPAAALYHETAAEGVTLVDLGEHHLRDLGRPERVHQLRAPGLRETFPPLRSGGVIPNNIPAFASAFIGRSREIAHIAALLESARGVTLCGTGGIGKTRCALRAGQDLLPRFMHGVWFVELASTGSGEDVASALAATLSLPISTNALESLCARLKTQSALLVLDNCEHVASHVAAMVETLLMRCPDIRVLSTSREPLGYHGEVVYRLPSLSLPPDSTPIAPQDALDYDAVALFLARAVDVDSTLRLTRENLPTVVSICRRLDGVALALELAAIRLRVISLEQLLAGLRARFRLLTAGSRTALPRQKTLRAMVDWSYELLDEEERRLFCGLSVFSGGFTLEACVAVCGPEAGAERDAIDVLGSLVDKSLVAAPSAEAARGEPRFRQLETLREYAAEKLRERGEAAVRFAAFGRWALELVTAAHAQWVTAPRADWEARFKLEVENVRAAVEWAFERDGDVALGLRIVTWARRMFGALAPREGLRLIELAQRARVPGGEASADGAPDEATVELTFAEAQMNIALRRPPAALERARAAAAAFTALGNEEFRREAQIIVGYALVLLGRGTEAKRELYEAQAYFERAQLVQFCGVIASDLGVAYAIDEKFDEARASFNAALHWFRRANNSRGIRVVVTNLAEMEFRGGSAESAIERISAELTRSGRADALLLSNLSAYLIAAGRFDQALEYGREAILAAEASGSEADTLLSLQHVAAAMLLEEGESAKRREWPSEAARLIGFVDARIGGNGAAREFTERQEYDRITSTLQQIFDAPTLECLFREGADWDERVAVAVALST